MSEMAPTDGELMAEDLGTFVNSFGHDTKGFVSTVMREHRYLQQKIFDLFFACMLEWDKAYTTGRFDDRNRAACKLSNQFMTEVMSK